MDWESILYALACVTVPVAWGLIVVWISNRIDRRLLRTGRRAGKRGAARPIEYHI
jgi:hypothetical protein